LSGTLSQIIQTCPAYSAVANHFDLLNTRRMERECPFHTNSLGDLAYSESLAQAPASLPDHNTLKNLDPFVVALNHLNVYPHGVTRAELRMIGSHLLLLNRLDKVHCHLPSLRRNVPLSILLGFCFPLRTALSSAADLD